MKFLIRDDDTCAFTCVNDLRKCYEDIWQTIPINLSVTPFRIPGIDPKGTVPQKYRGCQEILPLKKNRELVAFLKEKKEAGKINIALHGFHHTKPNGLPEYLEGTDLLKKTTQGKEYLEQLLSCKIDTFIPPNNGIGSEGLSALVANNLNLIGLPSLVRPAYRPFSIYNMAKYIHLKSFIFKHKCHYPYVVNISGHKEVSYCSVTPSQTLNFIMNYLEKSYEHKGIFILATHYHAFQKKLKSGEYIGDAINLIIERSKKYNNIHYCTYEQLWNKA